MNDQTLQYVRSLERRILEHESATTNSADGATNKTTNSETSNTNARPEILAERPEAVVRALQILEVREQLERDRAGNTSISPEQMDDGEKALLREMCNVVWRKLEENPSGPTVEPI